MAAAQAAYYISSGLWPVLHLRSFLLVTGPKVDLWLVQAFGLLVVAQGSALLFACVARREREALPFGFASCAMLALVDVWFVSKGTIRAVYLLDAGAEAILAAGWLMAGRCSAPGSRSPIRRTARAFGDKDTKPSGDRPSENANGVECLGDGKTPPCRSVE